MYVKILALASVFLLSGCTVGPDFHAPLLPKTKAYTKTALPTKYFVAGKDIPAAWWTLFHSTALNQLIKTGIGNNPTMTMASATLKQAEETLNAQVGSLFYPAVSAGLGGNRQRFSDRTIGQGGSSVFNLFNASVNVAYTLDIFGGSRRTVEALRAQVDYQYYVYVATYLTLTANIATTAITVSALEAEAEATRRLIQAQANQLAISEKQLHLGGVSGETILSQQTLLAETRALLPPIEKSLAQSRHALAVLVGDLPSESKLPKIKLNHLRLPLPMPVSVPSALVCQRPDVQAQAALLHKASANIGVATANLFPKFTLNANYGWLASTPSQLLAPASNVWGMSGQLLQPVFQGGSLLAERRAAIAAYEATRAQYRNTVLQAFQNVADALRAIEMDARAYRAYRQAEVSAKATMQMTAAQYRLGGVSYLEWLTAQEKYQKAVINRIKAEAARYTDTVALFQALGGGWWNYAVTR